MALEIVYETHSTTTDNEAGIATGRLPGRLSELGRRQAAELGARRRGGGFAAVFTSDLHRAVETARIAFPDGEPPVHQDVRLRECDYGDLNGAPATLVAAQRTARIDDPFPGGGQSYRQVLAATDAFLRDLATDWDGRRILLIAHSANRWALDCLLDGASLEHVLADPPAWRPGWHYTLPADRP
ncbi:histidine phosphatase family protein [Streptacidiphilus melanogenes]|uniref:histidine phosphatase family protein n=1 Tax=Streptacidiphilus melanogenes TaxID=411235 RepID=UPI0005A9AE61|nr:histidine phosphatase family protein [Streptacidiphilus melanogenes]